MSCLGVPVSNWLKTCFYSFPVSLVHSAIWPACLQPAIFLIPLHTTLTQFCCRLCFIFSQWMFFLTPLCIFICVSFYVCHLLEGISYFYCPTFYYLFITDLVSLIIYNYLFLICFARSVCLHGQQNKRILPNFNPNKVIFKKLVVMLKQNKGLLLTQKYQFHYAFLSFLFQPYFYKAWSSCSNLLFLLSAIYYYYHLEAVHLRADSFQDRV